MILTAQELGFTRGEDVLLDCFFPSADPDPPTIAGWAISFTIARVEADGTYTILLTKTVGSGITIVDPVLRQITIALSRGETLSLAAGGKYVWDCWRTDLNLHGVTSRGRLTVAERVGIL